MPANLTPQYLKAEEAYKQAKTPEEKLACLEEMLRLIPKHKGTEKLQADIKRRISALKKGKGAKGKPSRIDPFHVEKVGAGQVVLLGAPNTGKSRLVATLTRARPEVSEAPFTTQGPYPGMMQFEDIQIQLLDLPPITPEYIPPGMMGAVRNSDGILIFCDMGAEEALDQVELAIEKCEERSIILHPPLSPLKKPEELPIGVKQIPAIIICNKMDLEGAAERFKILEELYSSKLPLHPLSLETNIGIEEFKKKVFDMLEVIRIYSKEPGKPPDMDAPFTLKKGSTVLDLAREIHKELAEKLKFARIWGSARHDGIQVPRDYVLQDKDIVEIHA